MKFNKTLAGILAATAVLASFPMVASVITAETTAPAKETFEEVSDTTKGNISGSVTILESMEDTAVSTAPEAMQISVPKGDTVAKSFSDAIVYQETEAEETMTTVFTEVQDVTATVQITDSTAQATQAMQNAATETSATTTIPETTPVSMGTFVPAENPVSSSGYLTPSSGVYYGPSGKETYYNLDMSGVVSMMRNRGYDEATYPYWVRDDGVKMFGDYVMVAASLDIRPRGSLIETSLGMAIVCDTGGFAYSNPTQIDVAVNW